MAKKQEDLNKPFVYEEWAKSGKSRAPKGWGPKGFSTRLMNRFEESEKNRPDQKKVA